MMEPDEIAPAGYGEMLRENAELQLRVHSLERRLALVEKFLLLLDSFEGLLKETPQVKKRYQSNDKPLPV